MHIDVQCSDKYILISYYSLIFTLNLLLFVHPGIGGAAATLLRYLVAASTTLFCPFLSP